MPKCKICQENESDWTYWWFSARKCLQCNVELKRRFEPPLEVTKEDERRWEVSKKAVDKHLKSKERL